jgi:hypothetical protein
MGCWNGTCDITQLPILDNEECVMIDFNGVISGFTLFNMQGTDVTRIVKGKYSGYGDLIEFPDEEYPGITDSEKTDFNMRPKYIRSDGIIPVTLRSFIKKIAWDMIVDQSPDYKLFDGQTIKEHMANKPKLEGDELLGEENTQKVILKMKQQLWDLNLKQAHAPNCDYNEEFMKVFKVMYSCRMTFSGIAYEGCQHIELKSHDLRRKVIDSCYDTLNNLEIVNE